MSLSRRHEWIHILISILCRINLAKYFWQKRQVNIFSVKQLPPFYLAEMMITVDTHVRVCSPVNTRTHECHELVASLVDHETTHWKYYDKYYIYYIGTFKWTIHPEQRGIFQLTKKQKAPPKKARVPPWPFLKYITIVTINCNSHWLIFLLFYLPWHWYPCLPNPLNYDLWEQRDRESGTFFESKRIQIQIILLIHFMEMPKYGPITDYTESYHD